MSKAAPPSFANWLVSAQGHSPLICKNVGVDDLAQRHVGDVAPGLDAALRRAAPAVGFDHDVGGAADQRVGALPFLLRRQQAGAAEQHVRDPRMIVAEGGPVDAHRFLEGGQPPRRSGPGSRTCRPDCRAASPGAGCPARTSRGRCRGRGGTAARRPRNRPCPRTACRGCSARWRAADAARPRSTILPGSRPPLQAVAAPRRNRCRLL